MADAKQVMGQLDIPHPEATHAGFIPGTAPDQPTQRAFARALDQIRTDHPDAVAKRFPELLATF